MSLRVVLVDCGSRKVGALAHLIEQAGAECRSVALSAMSAAELALADALVISGGPHLFTADPTLEQAFAFLEGLALPTLGICLGHQALGLVHGASVFLGPARREPESIHLLPGHPLVAGLGAEAVFGEDHTEGITCPLGFRVVGFSAHYRVEIMAHARLPLFGVQFHPEISGDPGLCLIGNFLALARQAGSR